MSRKCGISVEQKEEAGGMNGCIVEQLHFGAFDKFANMSCQTKRSFIVIMKQLLALFHTKLTRYS